MRIVGLDHGNTSTGFGVVDYNIVTKDLTYVKHGYNRIDTKNSPYPRSLQIQSHWASMILQEYKPDIVALEGAKDIRGYVATSRLMELLGCVKCQCVTLKIPFTEIPPSTMKKIVTGNGFATKEEVALVTSNMFNIPFDELVGFLYYKHGVKKGQRKSLVLDGSDALALATAAPTYLLRSGLDYDGK